LVTVHKLQGLHQRHRVSDVGRGAILGGGGWKNDNDVTCQGKEDWKNTLGTWGKLGDHDSDLERATSYITPKDKRSTCRGGEGTESREVKKKVNLPRQTKTFT